jgi:hypothetical protein
MLSDRKQENLLSGQQEKKEIESQRIQAAEELASWINEKMLEIETIPTRAAMIEVIAEYYKEGNETAEQWLINSFTSKQD